MGLLRPTVEAIESRVSDTRAAQEELRDHISALQEDLYAIATKSEAQKAGIDLEAAVEKLNNAKRRVVVVANLLQGAQVRGALHVSNISTIVFILGHGSWRKEGGRNGPAEGAIDFSFRGGRMGFKRGEGGIELEKSSKWAQKWNFFAHFKVILCDFWWVFREKNIQSRGATK